jgi:hypothetical protein
MFRRHLYCLTLLILSSLIVLGCSSKKESEAKDDLRSALGVKNATQLLDFEYKTGYVGTKFVENEKAYGSTEKEKNTAFISKKVSKLSIDKIEYIQNYIFQKNDPSFILLENRTLLIRVHAYANISNIAAPDMLLTIEGPGNIRFSERIGATGGLPAMPENSNQNVNYTLSPFTQSYLFKIPGEHLKHGEYKLKLEPIFKHDSGLSGEPRTDTFSITEEPAPITIELFQGSVGKKMARLPEPGSIIKILRQYWPIGDINIEFIPDPLIVEAFDIPNLNALVAEAKQLKEYQYPDSKYVALFQKTAEALNQTRTLTESSAIQVLFLPVPEGGAHSMQSIAVSDTHWEQHLARQIGHALGLGMSKQCAAPPIDPSAPPSASTSGNTSSDKKEKTDHEEDKGDYTLEPVPDYIWDRRYWNLTWTQNQIHLSPPNENDLMSLCNTTRFPHPYFFRKAFINMTTSATGPLANHPSKAINDYLSENGLSFGPALRVELDFDEVRRALIQNDYKHLPRPRWSAFGELSRVLRNNQLKSPHAIVVEGGPESNPSQRIIGLYLSKDKKSLVGVTNLVDLPIPIKQYRVWINKTPINNESFESPFNRFKPPAAKAGRKDGLYLFAWNAKEIYNFFPGTLIQKSPGKNTAVLGIMLTRGTLKVPTQTVPDPGRFYLLLPIKGEKGLILDNLPLFSADFTQNITPVPKITPPPLESNPMNPTPIKP